MGMAYLRAWATVRDTPTEELQERLREAFESLHEIASTLLCDETYALDQRLSVSDRILFAIKDFRDDIKSNDAERDQATADCAAAEAERDEALERLEKKLHDEPDAQALRDELDAAKKRIEELTSEVNSLRNLAEPYAAALAAARKFVSAAEGSGVKVRSVRRVK